jgi:4-hydroxy-4-methyl-2-oxoglutarate aldolase
MQPLTDFQLKKLKSLTTPAIANIIESFTLRLRNEGYTDRTIINQIAMPKHMLGYAVTAKMRTSEPPMHGSHYPDRNDWWNALEAAPNPKIIVIEDTDRYPGTGSVCGGLHSVIFKTLGCIGIVTNGAVRDLPELEKQHMHVYSGSISPSHAYAHIIEVGTPIKIAGLPIKSGDLLHGDMHGIVNIPLSIAPDIHPRAQTLLNHELEIVKYCTEPGFSLEKLRTLVSALVSSSPEETR